MKDCALACGFCCYDRQVWGPRNFVTWYYYVPKLVGQCSCPRLLLVIESIWASLDIICIRQLLVDCRDGDVSCKLQRLTIVGDILRFWEIFSIRKILQSIGSCSGRNLHHSYEIEQSLAILKNQKQTDEVIRCSDHRMFECAPFWMFDSQQNWIWRRMCVRSGRETSWVYTESNFKQGCSFSAVSNSIIRGSNSSIGDSENHECECFGMFW